MTSQGDALLPFVGFGGGGIGALLGWLAALRISRQAIANPQRRAALLFLHKGPPAVEEYLVNRDAVRRSFSLGKWSSRFGDLVRESKDVLLGLDVPRDEIIEMLLRVWIRTLADMFNYLMVEADDPRTDHWHLRVSFIRFDKGEGAHWISYSGTARPHRSQKFSSESVAYKVVTGELASPSSREPDDEGVPSRGSEPYWAFSVFRVNEWLALSIDWERDIRQDENLELLHTTVHSHLVPGAREILNHHSLAESSPEGGTPPPSSAA